MKVLEKIASSLGDAISLVLGEGVKKPEDIYNDTYPFVNRY